MLKDHNIDKFFPKIFLPNNLFLTIFIPKIFIANNLFLTILFFPNKFLLTILFPKTFLPIIFLPAIFIPTILLLKMLPLHNQGQQFRWSKFHKSLEPLWIPPQRKNLYFFFIQKRTIIGPSYRKNHPLLIKKVDEQYDFWAKSKRRRKKNNDQKGRRRKKNTDQKGRRRKKEINDRARNIDR